MLWYKGRTLRVYIILCGNWLTQKAPKDRKVRAPSARMKSRRLLKTAGCCEGSRTGKINLEWWVMWWLTVLEPLLALSWHPSCRCILDPLYWAICTGAPHLWVCLLGLRYTRPASWPGGRSAASPTSWATWRTPSIARLRCLYHCTELWPSTTGKHTLEENPNPGTHLAGGNRWGPGTSKIGTR